VTFVIKSLQLSQVLRNSSYILYLDRNFEFKKLIFFPTIDLASETQTFGQKNESPKLHKQQTYPKVKQKQQGQYDVRVSFS
jgi:hypothetical protein